MKEKPAPKRSTEKMGRQPTASSARERKRASGVPSNAKSFPVAGFRASARGYESFTRFLEALPLDNAMAPVAGGRVAEAEPHSRLRRRACFSDTRSAQDSAQRPPTGRRGKQRRDDPAGHSGRDEGGRRMMRCPVDSSGNPGEHRPPVCGLRHRAANLVPLIHGYIGKTMRTARRLRRHAGRVRSPT